MPVSDEGECLVPVEVMAPVGQAVPVPLGAYPARPVINKEKPMTSEPIRDRAAIIC